jgi:serine phosphatase RsbU (regulator of sigma subunit)/anti-sigma regulatory factor (Ser/Thr protein kinase)
MGVASGRALVLLGATLIAGVVGSFILQERVASHLIARVVTAQTMKVHDHVHRFDQTLRYAEQSVSRFAALVSYNSATLEGVSTDLTSMAQLDADGAWRTPVDRLKAGNEAAVWIPPGVVLTRETRQFFVRTQAITRLFGLGAQDALLTNTWALPLTNGEVIFWPDRPDFVGGATADLDYRQTPWVQLTAPRLNPRGTPRWTDPDYDPAAREWLISVVAPFQRDGSWAGSVGHDIELRHLLSALIDHTIAPGSADAQPLFVVSASGQVLARHQGTPRKGEKLPMPYRPALQQARSKQHLLVRRDGLNYLLIAPIPVLKAYVIYRVDGDGISHVLGEELLVLQIGEGVVVALLVGSVLAIALRDAQSRLQRQRLLEEQNMELEHQVQRRTAELQRVNAMLENDLNLAARIQRDLLATERQINALTPHLDLGVVLAASREVAGDLYDCIPLAGDRYLLCVGDVSGKGMPAALLMSTCLSLLRAYAEVLDSPSAIMRRLNRRLCHNNPTCAFTTLVLAVLDSRNGELSYCNAGHNPSLLKRRDGPVESLGQVHGPALGVEVQITYGESKLYLGEGDALIAYTDGASEMFSPDHRRFGLARMQAYFQSSPHTSSRRQVRLFLRALRDFAAGEPQHDDITVLIAQRHRHADPHGSAAMVPPESHSLELTLHGADSGLRQLRTAVATYCQREGIQQRLQRRLKVIVDELVSNLLLHAHAQGGHELLIEVKLDRTTEGLQLCMRDNGQPFNPLEAPSPDVASDLEDRAIGGLGLHLVRQLASSFTYRREGNSNVLTLELG